MLTLVCDLDGTLIDSREGIVRSMQHVLPQVTEADVPIGPKLPQIVEKLLPRASDDERADVRRRFAEYYDSVGYQHSRLYNGTADALRELGELGVTLHIATYKRTIPTKKILTMLDIDRHFRHVLCVDTEVMPAHDRAATPRSLSKQEMVGLIPTGSCKPIFVGDSRDDQEAAVALGIEFWWAAYGYGSCDPTQVSVRLEQFSDVVHAIRPKLQPKVSR